MGAWDHTPFGNDDACDWGSDLRSAEDLSFIEETLDAVVHTGEEYLEAPESSQGIAAAEVVNVVVLPSTSLSQHLFAKGAVVTHAHTRSQSVMLDSKPSKPVNLAIRGLAHFQPQRGCAH